MPRQIVQDFKASLNFGAGGATSNVVSCASSSAFSVGTLTQYSFAFWIKARGVTGGNRIIDATPFLVFLSGSGSGYSLTAQVTHSTTAGGVTSGTLVFNSWVRVLYTWSDTDLRPNIYINGILSNASGSDKAGTRSATSATVYIGNRSALDRAFNGQLEELAIWNRVLTATEIANDAASYPPPTNGLISYKKLGDGAGTVARDEVDPGLNGTISGATFTSDTPSTKRQLVGGNLVTNGDFEYAPPFTAATTTTARYIDGTAAGSTTNSLFNVWYFNGVGASNSVQFDTGIISGSNSSLRFDLGAGGQNRVVMGASTTGASLPLSNIINPAIVKPSTSYTLTYTLKTTSMNTGFAVQRHLHTVAGTRTSNTAGTSVSGTTPATTYSDVFTTSATDYYLILNIQPDNGGGAGTATAWIDSITLTETVTVPRSVVQDFKSSLQFDGTNTLINRANIPGLDAYSSKTICLFINPATVTGINQNIVSFAASTTSYNTLSIQSSGQFRVELNGSGGGMRYNTSVGVPVAGQWQMLAYAHGTLNNLGTRVTGDLNRINVNGKDVPFTTSAIGGAGTNSSEFTMGRIALTNGANPYKGKICRMLAFTQVLTEAELTRVYASGGSSLPYVPVAQWDLGEGAGGVAYDTSGNANNGTITAGTFSADVPSRKRQLVNSNLIYNGDSEYYPPAGANVANTNLTGNFGVAGTATGSQANTLFGWRTRVGTGSVAYIQDTTTFYSGSASLKVSTLATGSVALLESIDGRVVSTTTDAMNSRTMPLLPNTQYTLTCRLKTQANSGSAITGARITVYERSGTGSLLSTAAGGGYVTVTQNWTLVTINFTSTANTRYATIVPEVAGNDGAGTLIMDAWFDDIDLRPTVNTARTLVS